MLTLPPKKPEIFVIDTSAIIHRIQYTAEDVRLATTPLLEKEMREKGLKESVDLLIATQKLQVITPTTTALQRVRKAASQLGDLSFLSEPDQHLLALALDLRDQTFHPIVVTDDYSIQNVAKQLGLDIKSVTQRGIREIIRWEIYCKACGYQDAMMTKDEPCPVCGSPVKRRAIDKESLNAT
ncbi:MAG: NOB1 family endonuclease [Candidatus Hodarchaeota archaeon]